MRILWRKKKIREKHGSQVDLIFRFLDHAFATGVLG
ncbi:hypothetical protein HUSEC41_06876 [Escherichia coli O104:H4 str. 01-09591]|nr:hypothetical protein HUSEC41_06876 [Escherichia coli O104:H4 str. 01-09591]